MDRNTRLFLAVLLVCSFTQVYSFSAKVNQRDAGLHHWDDVFTNTNELHRRQDYGKSPVNWEQIWKLKALLDQVGRRK